MRMGPFPRKLILCKEDCTYSADLKNFHGGEGERDELLEAVLEQEDLEETAEEVTEENLAMPANFVDLAGNDQATGSNTDLLTCNNCEVSFSRTDDSFKCDVHACEYYLCSAPQCLAEYQKHKIQEHHQVPSMPSRTRSGNV